MKKTTVSRLFFTALLLTLSLSAFTQTYYTRASGAWNDNTSVWSTVSQSGAACSCNPGTSISGSNTVYVYNTINSYNVLASLSGSGKLIIEAGDSATINISNFSLSGSSSITVNGTLIIYGALTMTGSSGITISSTGTVYVYGNISNSGSANVADNGSLTVHGNVSTSGSAGFTGSGKSYVIGTVTGPNTSMLSVLPDFFSSFSSATGTGLVAFKTAPSLAFQPLNYNGNASTVLTGNGTFVNGSTFSPWVLSSNNVYYNAGNVGVGTSSPAYPLQVVGNANFSTLNTGSTGIATYNTSGTLQPLNFNGNASTVLTGNGTFANVSSLSPWVQSGTNLYYNAGNIGIGTSGPLLYPLVVQGTALVNGTLYANNISAANGMSVGSFRIVNGMVDSIDSIVSNATVLRLSASAVSVTNNFTAVGITGTTITGTTVTGTSVAGTTVTAGTTGPSLITLDGNAGTITSPSGSVGFGNNNITTSGTVNAGTLNTSYLTMDSTKTRNISPRDSVISFGDPVVFLTLPPATFPRPAYWNNTYGTEFLGAATNPCAAIVGIGTISNSSALTISSCSAPNQITVLNPTSNNTVFNVDKNGVTVIGSGLTTPVGYNLYVANGILTEAVKIAVHGTPNWSDYVFANNYKLKPLADVEKFVQENKHLPDVPSAADVKKDGINVADMDATLLKKIEELTLYMIQQQKKIDALQNKVDELSKNAQK